jgi:hypothetical protein
VKRIERVQKTTEKRRSARQTSIKPTRIFIGSQAYPLANVSREGVGIQIEGEHSFFMGQRLAAIKIETDQATRYFDGTISHITHHQAGIICGIRFILKDIEAYNHMARYAQERRV